MDSRRQMTTADLAARGDDLRGRGDEHAAGRSARDAAETFMRHDVGTAGSSGTLPASGTPSPTQRPDSVQEPSDRPAPGHEASDTPMLFPHDEAGHYRSEWTQIQSAFVDSPRQAVERADALIATVMQQLAATFARERSALEGQWDRGGDVTTEDLRVVLQRYRSFFDRLLSV